MVPHRNGALKDILNYVWAAPKLSANGDVINYIPVIDFNKRKILEGEGLFEKYVEYIRNACVLREIELDRLSLEQRRLVRLVVIFDLHGCSMSSLYQPAFDKRFEEDVSKFQQAMFAETIAFVHVINAPYFVTKFFNFIKGIIPARFLAKFQLQNENGSDNHEFLQDVGGLAQLEQLLLTRKGCTEEMDNELAGEHTIQAGQVFEKVIEIAPGQRIFWNFRVISGRDRLLGVSDVEFSVVGYWYGSHEAVSKPIATDLAEASTEASACGNEKEDAPEDGNVLHAPVMVAASDDLTEGYFDAVEEGIVLIRWSNHHSWTRRKNIWYSLEIGPVVTLDRGPESGLGESSDGKKKKSSKKEKSSSTLLSVAGTTDLLASLLAKTHPKRCLSKELIDLIQQPEVGMLIAQAADKCQRSIAREQRNRQKLHTELKAMEENLIQVEDLSPRILADCRRELDWSSQFECQANGDTEPQAGAGSEEILEINELEALQTELQNVISAEKTKTKDHKKRIELLWDELKSYSSIRESAPESTE
eukprot:gnl/MRDRNA2_/MRDRNA2_174716_c0_seq1.p1 gnl/MRDRNA2_/MRDRNA2_174716_c0~~gnl/MRDRNA2_/MRDRNA2_174716_c0_seq1.p1  ORF type:complete len:549 (+),score=105.63 gnl/MRDRNA2_/MRDRNA2_174716_c0_seq1:53-1648(+)